jgi:hypothetical protein
MGARRIEFRGVTVTEDWPERLREAQDHPTVERSGVAWPRIRFGDERRDWGAERGPCHDCAAIKGEFHVLGCDVERCPACGGQLITCDCNSSDAA